MAFCRQCGAPLQEGTKFCSECGAPADSAPVRMASPQLEYPAEKPKKKRKSIFKRWWFWVLAVIVIAGIAGRSGAKTLTKPTARSPSDSEADRSSDSRTCGRSDRGTHDRAADRGRGE